MKKAIVMTLCAAMAVGMIGSVSTVYAADADIASDDAIKKAADEGWGNCCCTEGFHQSMVRSHGHRR